VSEIFVSTNFYVNWCYNKKGGVSVILCRIERQGSSISVNTLGEKSERIVTVAAFKRILQNEMCLCQNAILTKDNKLRIVKNRFETIDLQKFVNFKNYGGKTSNKYGITYNNVDYMVKPAKSGGDFSVISEYVASHFINSFNSKQFSAHETLLFLDKKQGLVVACKDFTKKGIKLHSYGETGQSSEDTDMTTKIYSYADICYSILKHTKLNSDTVKSNMLQHFWFMFCLDAVLGNRDRNPGNWGYLVRNKGNYFAAPMYDNAGSLFSDVNRKITEYTRESRRKFILERSYFYPASVLETGNQAQHRRTNYFDYIAANGLQIKELSNALNYFNSFDVATIKRQITDIIISSEYIPYKLGYFYIDVVCMRYLMLISGTKMYRQNMSWEEIQSILWEKYIRI